LYVLYSWTVPEKNASDTTSSAVNDTEMGTSLAAEKSKFHDSLPSPVSPDTTDITETESFVEDQAELLKMPAKEQNL